MASQAHRDTESTDAKWCGGAPPPNLDEVAEITRDLDDASNVARSLAYIPQQNNQTLFQTQPLDQFDSAMQHVAPQKAHSRPEEIEFIPRAELARSVAPANRAPEGLLFEAQRDQALQQVASVKAQAPQTPSKFRVHPLPRYWDVSHDSYVTDMPVSELHQEIVDAFNTMSVSFQLTESVAKFECDAYCQSSRVGFEWQLFSKGPHETLVDIRHLCGCHIAYHQLLHRITSKLDSTHTFPQPFMMKTPPPPPPLEDSPAPQVAASVKNVITSMIDMALPEYERRNGFAAIDSLAQQDNHANLFVDGAQATDLLESVMQESEKHNHDTQVYALSTLAHLTTRHAQWDEALVGRLVQSLESGFLITECPHGKREALRGLVNLSKEGHSLKQISDFKSKLEAFEKATSDIPARQYAHAVIESL